MTGQLQVYMARDYILVNYYKVTKQDIEELMPADFKHDPDANIYMYDNGVEYAYPLVVIIDKLPGRIVVQVGRDNDDNVYTYFTIDAADYEELIDKLEELKRKATGRQKEIELPLDLDLNLVEVIIKKMLSLHNQLYNKYGNEEEYSLEELLGDKLRA